MRESWLVNILKYGIYATAFVPLIIFKDYISPFHFGKIIVFRSLVEVLLVFYLILIWKNKSYRPKPNSIFWAFFAFTSIFGLTTLTSIQWYESFWGTLERMGGFFSFLHFFVFFVILISIFKSKEDWFKLLKITIFVGLLSALYGLGQKTNIQFFVGSGNRARIFGTIGNAALFAGYQLTISFLSLMFLTRKNNSQVEKIFYFFAFLLSGVSVLMSAVRGSVLGLGLGLFTFCLFYVWIYRSKIVKNIVLGLVVFAVIFIIGSLALKDTKFVKSSRYLTRMTDFSVRSYTVQTRFWAWEAGLKSWDDSPKTILFGWGPENFNIPFSINFNPKFFNGPGSETFFDRAHNMFVEILVTMGIIGFLSYVSLYLSLFKSLWTKLKKSPPEEAIYYIGIFSLLVGSIFHVAFFFDITANFVVFFTIVGFVYFLATHKLDSDMSNMPTNRKLSGSQVLGLAILLILSFWLISIVNIKPSKANYATTRAIVRGWSGDPKGAVKKFEEALSYDTFGLYEYRHRFAQFIFENYGKLEAKNVEFAIEEVRKNLEARPKDYLPLLYLSRLNILLGRQDPSSKYNDIALDYAQKALEISPNFVRTYFEIGQVYLNKKDLENASEAFKKAAELNPNVGISYWYRAIVELDRGNSELAMDLVQKALTVSSPFSPSKDDFNRLINFYSKSNDHKGLVTTLETMIAREPYNPEYHAKLAAVYAQGKRIEDAVKHAKIAAALDRNFESEARAFIQSIGGKW